MKIRTNYVLDNSVYRASINTEDWSELDSQLMTDFSEPEIDLGGDFDGPPEFSLSNRLALIKSNSPFTEGFDSRDYDDAEDRANLWAATIVIRLTAAITLLRTYTDTFSREIVENV